MIIYVLLQANLAHRHPEHLPRPHPDFLHRVDSGKRWPHNRAWFHRHRSRLLSPLVMPTADDPARLELQGSTGSDTTDPQHFC